MKRRPGLSRGVLLGVVVLAGCRSSHGASLVIKASASSAANEPSVKALEVFGREVSARTAGRIKVEVYPNNALGNEREAIELAIVGAIELVSPANAPLATFAPELMVFDLPYLFRDRPHMYAVLDGPLGQRLAEPLRARGLELLGYFELGLRHVMSTGRPIASLNDMAGLKIRTMENPLHLRAFRAFGASPLPMAYGEVYTAIEQGVIDGAEAARSNYYSKRFYEVAHNWSEIGWMYLVSPVVMSRKFFDSLSPADQAAVREAAAVAVAFEREEYQRQDDEALTRLKASGVTIAQPDRAGFLDAARRVWRESADLVDTNLVKAIESYGEKRE